MDSLIRETNDNLKVIIDTLKNNLEDSINTLENIQMSMDKKVEEAKKYKIQVDDAKDKIKKLEEDNKSLELSLKELNDKYGKMNLVSLVEAGNREIKTKINDNNREINKEKEHIADLTNKARTIKDLLINLKKDKEIKESRLENIKAVYEYYNNRINDIMDFAFNHAENLNDYKEESYYSDTFDNLEEVNDTELENTMIFDEIANIDESKNFKDEISFINDQIDDTMNYTDKIDEIVKRSLEAHPLDEIEEVKVNEDKIDSTQIFDAILNEDINELEEENEETVINNSELFINEEVNEPEEIKELEPEVFNEEPIEINETNEINDIEFENLSIYDNEDIKEENDSNETLDIENVTEENDSNETIEIDNEEEFNTIKNLDVFNIEDDAKDYEEMDESEDRISKINDLFSSLDNTKTSNIPLNNGLVNNTINEIDNAYKDIFGQTLEENDLNKTTTLTDIFGNPIKKEEISEEIKISKKIEELFVENGIDMNKFKEDEKNYLRQIYDEEKFNNILNILKKNKINLDNIYNSFNIFGEITDIELDNIINKLITSGQSIEAIGLVLEKLPKVKKYNLEEAINSYGDYIKDIDITELIMKAKELYDGGNK